jgi:DNA segregation ATPase FtsK/SpoIIIE-like protein
MIIAPPDSGASELIRTFMISLALSNSPNELQILGIDIGGQELGILESLPHNHWDLATDVSSAVSSIDWLCRMADFRRDAGQVTPHILLVIDDLTTVLDRIPDLASNLHSLFIDGPEAGIHLIAAAEWPITVHQKWLNEVDGVKAMLPKERSGSDSLLPGRFQLGAKGHSIEMDTAWLRLTI